MNRKLHITALVAVLFAILLVPVMIDDAYAAGENDGTMIPYFGIMPVSDDNPIELKAGGETEVRIAVVNNSLADDWRFVKIQAIGSKNVEPLQGVIPVNGAVNGKLDNGEISEIILTFSADRYVPEGAEEITLLLSYMVQGTEDSILISETLTVYVLSDLSASGQFNKIMGFFPNNLPSPFDTHMGATLMTFGIWVIISLVAVVLLKTVLRVPMKRSEHMKDIQMDTAYRMLTFLIIVFGVYESLKVLGVSEYLVDISGKVASILYVVLGAIIGWEIYKVIVHHVFAGRGKDVAPGGVDETLVPLFNMIGKIIIGTIATAGIFSILGADLMGIIAGAGIAGLAISLGAQNLLKQFFSGISLLAIRPFKEGDHIRLDGGDELKVHSVGIMTTWFKNPWNEEIITMPNDKVSESKITNMTGENLRYRFNFFIEVTRDSDLTLAKKLLTDAAMDRPEIITDGSIMMPFARATELTDFGVKIRLSAYVHVYETKWAAEAAIMERILREFKENGIRVAYRRYDIRTEPRDMDEYDL